MKDRKAQLSYVGVGLAVAVTLVLLRVGVQWLVTHRAPFHQ